MTHMYFFLVTLPFQFGPMKFWETIDLEVTFDIDLHKRRADGNALDRTLPTMSWVRFVIHQITKDYGGLLIVPLGKS